MRSMKKPPLTQRPPLPFGKTTYIEISPEKKGGRAGTSQRSSSGARSAREHYRADAQSLLNPMNLPQSNKHNESKASVFSFGPKMSVPTVSAYASALGGERNRLG